MAAASRVLLPPPSPGALGRGIGSVCTLRCYGWREALPDPLDQLEGDFLRTAAGTCYQITEVRRCRPGSRCLFTMKCVRLGKNAVQFGEPGVHGWRFSRR